MKPAQAHKLILGLTAPEVMAEITKIFKQFDAKIILDFDQPDKLARLYLQFGELTEELWMAADSRKRLAYTSPWMMQSSQKFLDKLDELLKENQAKLVFFAEKPKNQKAICKLQMHVQGARTYAITMAEARRGEIVKEHEFLMPGETE